MSSPYASPDFYRRALDDGRHREITGGWWEETGRIQLELLQAQGMAPRHRLLDIGAGALRLGRRAVPFLDPGHYWATDASGELMHRGWEVELDADARARLPLAQLVEDATFAFPGVPEGIDHAIAWGVFPHLPPACLRQALCAVRNRFPRLQALLFTVFLQPEGGAGPARRDGVVTHADRAPFHRRASDVLADAEAAGLALTLGPARLPRGQTLYIARPA